MNFLKLKAFLILSFGFLFCALSFALSPLDYENNPKFEEIYRIKIWNLPGGTVEVSRDEGKTWEPAGKVIYPTQKTNPEGYTASRWVGDGKVAATAVNAVHVKTATSTQDGRGIIFSLLPNEFMKPAKNYKSYLSPDSSIYTDIPAGEGIFGGGYAPFVGNVVMVSRPGLPVIPLPRDYVPRVGDKIYIMVDRPVDYPREMVFENRFAGRVTISYFGGGERLIAWVVQPVRGVGRFEGSRYALPGRIRANHAGVIDVSTSSLGKVGGFQIVPSRHGASFEAAAQWMVVAPLSTGEADLEGRAPLFRYFIKPSYRADDLEAEDWEKRLLERFLVEVKLEGSDKWRSMPVYEFNDYYLSGNLPDWANCAMKDIASIRLLFPIPTRD